MAPAAKRGLIFDLDGTLVDSLQGIANSLNHALTSSGLPTHDNTAVRGFIGNGARMLVERAIPSHALDQHRAATEAAFHDHYHTNWQSGTSLYNGIAALLEKLQAAGHPLGVLSNKPHPFTVAIVHSLFPGIEFGAILGQREGIPHKPDPRGALEIAKLLDREPGDCALIGDSTVDIETAKNAGMQAIAVTWGFHDAGRLNAADAIARDVNELAALLE